MTERGAEHQVPYSRLARVCGGLAASGGGIALVGWVVGLPALAGAGSGWFPMAPSTALLFVLYGVAVLCRARSPLRGGAYWLGALVSCAGALVAVLVLFLSYHGMYPRAEHFGLRIEGAVGGVPIGHMSPVTALGFLLASLSLLAAPPSFAKRPWRAVTAWCLAGALVAVFSVLLLAYLYGTPLLYAGSFVPPAAATSLAFVLLGTALLALAGPYAWPRGGTASAAGPAAPVLFLVFVVLAAGIVAAGYLHIQSFEAHYRAAVQRELSSVGELRVSELLHYRQERLGDGSTFFRNAPFAALVRRVFDNPADGEAQAHLRDWLGKVWANDAYDRVTLLDARGAERIAIPESSAPISPVITRRATEIARTGVIGIEDFYRNELDQRIYLSVLVPIFGAPPGDAALGVLALRIDPHTYLYPSLNRFSTSRDSAEVLLIRRDEDGALYLNEPRFRKQAELTFRLPLDGRDAPAVKAVSGYEGIVEGVDYRGVPVIADVRAVPDSPWYLVTKLDASEAFALPRERMWVVIALVVALLAGAGAVVGRIWRQQSARFHRKERWAEERLRLQGAALDAAANAMVITDREGAIQWVNPAFTQMTGYALGEAVGRNPRDLVKSGQHDQAFFKNLWDTILAGGVWHGEMINRRKDGSLYTEEQTITPVRDERREIGHFISIKQDVTEQRRLEAQLRQAQRMEAIGQFAGGIAHDFNNQIFVMNGYCDFLLAEAAEQPALVGPLAEVKKAAQRAADLTAKILAFSRKQVLQPKVLDLNVELVDSEALLRRLIGADVRLTFRVGEDVGHVKVDPVQLQQVMMNLAANARDAMPQGGQLTIETANVVLDETYTRSRLDVTPGHYVLLALSDTGHGMDRETQARLFEPFFTTKDPGKGTGLGLASVYGIVKQSGGHVSVYSEIGRGTTFKIFLPWVDEPVETSRHRVVEQPAHGWETILLAEDEAAVRELVCRVLAAHGYRVLPAADGREALQLAERCDGPIHLLLTDVVMPGMSGSQLAERLAAVHPETRVIYMSGYAEDAVTRHGALTLGLAFLPKPCSTDLLVRKVREILDAPPRESLRGRRVLVVDDSEDERLLEARVISKAGGVAIGASGGAEALAVLEREAVDAVVTDVNMPSMDGFALTAAIRRSPPWQRLPVIILSGLYTEDEEARARAVGATACVSKGATDRQALLDILVEVIAAAEDRAAPLPRP